VKVLAMTTDRATAIPSHGARHIVSGASVDRTLCGLVLDAFGTFYDVARTGQRISCQRCAEEQEAGR